MGVPAKPKFVFIESTELFKLGPAFENLEFEKLLELRPAAEFRVLISEVSWLEYLRKQKRELISFLDSCEKMNRHLEKHAMPIAGVSAASQGVNEYVTGIDAHFRGKAAVKGVEVLPLPALDLERLLRMSIDCIPPFEESDSTSKEKGFRDSLIMFSVLEFLRSQSGAPSLVVTSDQLLTKAFAQHAPEFGANVIVFGTLDQASLHISKSIEEYQRAKIQEETDAAIQILSRYRDKIATLVSEIREVPKQELLSSRPAMHQWLLEISPSGDEVRGVKSVSFRDIDAAICKETGATRRRILFSCLCQAIVLVPSHPVPDFQAKPPTFKVGEPPKDGTWGVIGSFLNAAPLDEQLRPFHAYGVAEVEQEGTDWRLVEIKLDAVPDFSGFIETEIPRSEPVS
jgi:PIN domain